jgi:ankyrin repeat protein
VTLKIVMVGMAGAITVLAATETPKGDDAALFTAIRNGDGKAMRTLAEKGAAVNAKNAAGETPLMYAALYGTVEPVKLLLERGADPNIASAAGNTALMFATDDIRKVKMLVEHGAQVNAPSATGRTALAIAASRSGGGEATPLIEAAKIRDGEALRALLVRCACR